MWLANANAAVWAVGNGLVSTALVTFLAMQLGARGLEVSLIVAASSFVGVLRLGAPLLTTTGPARKQVAIIGYLASAAMLLVLSTWGISRAAHASHGALALLIGCWCFYHLLEYIATVALWSWLGDWMPRRVRGRLVAWREQYLLGGRIVGVVASVLLASLWWRIDPAAPSWQGMAWSATAGAVAMALAVVPLVWLAPRSTASGPKIDLLGETLHALTDPAYRRLLAYNCWLALANGITTSAMYLYAKLVLGISYSHLVGLHSLMYVGQTVVAPASGRWIDRVGARRLMVAAQLVVATGPLFYWLASPEARWWIAGAFVVWIAYAPLNVGLDTLKLNLAPTSSHTPSLAVYYAAGDLVRGATVVLAGLWYDRLQAAGGDSLLLFAGLFITGWVLRSLAALLAARLVSSPATIEK